LYIISLIDNTYNAYGKWNDMVQKTISVNTLIQMLEEIKDGSDIDTLDISNGRNRNPFFDKDLKEGEARPLLEIKAIIILKPEKR